MNSCTFCGQSSTHYRVVDIVANKAISEYYLCTTCGQAYIEAVFTSKNVTKIIPKPDNQVVQVQVVTSAAELLALLVGKGLSHVQKTEIHAPCDECGHSLADLQASGKFGCPHCYQHFDDTIVPIVDMAQKGSKKHVGKVPKHFMRSRIDPVDTDHIERLKILKLKLARALEFEHYEEAAKLRDEIKTLE